MPALSLLLQHDNLAALDYMESVLGRTTYGDIHGKNLKSDGQDKQPNPFKRVLDFQCE
jgi:hypothetical protein